MSHHHLPWINVGMNTCAVWLRRLHSCATLTAVRGLSPVIILHARCADRRAWIAGAVPGFSLFSKMTKPRNRRPDSACSLYHRCDSGSAHIKTEQLTASSSAPSATTTHRCSCPPSRSHDIRAWCNMKGGHRSHPGLIATVSSVTFLLYEMGAHMNPTRICQP